jgi:REP element-mobilizing transposase RayT
MARRKLSFVAGQYYHIYNRGANRERIFRIEDNYIFLLRRLKEHIIKTQISVIAYCLMPNHFHFLFRQDGAVSISQLMQAVFNSYTKAFNKAFDRSGTLFEGPFEAILIDRNDHLIHLCRYIHRNPLDAGLVSHPGQWLYSNYLEWVEERAGTLLDRGFVRDLFPDPKGYERFVLEYIPPKDTDRSVKKLTLE